MQNLIKRIKLTVIPQQLMLQGSAMRIHLDEELTQDLPYYIFWNEQSTLLSILTLSGYCLKYSFESLV